MSCCCERQSVMNECWHILMDLLPQISDLITIFINQEIKIITQSIKLQIFGFLSFWCKRTEYFWTEINLI